MSNSIAIGVAYQDQDIIGGSLNNSPIGATTPSTIIGTTLYATSEIGYSAAAQGSVTQAATSGKATAVTLNKSSGQITMDNATLNAATNVAFTLTNSAITAKDVIIFNVAGGNATAGTYNVFTSTLAAGSATVVLRNISAGPLSEAVVLNFAVIHAQ
jgi:hypothetical protein